MSITLANVGAAVEDLRSFIGRAVARQPAHDVESDVDGARHAAAGDQLALIDDALVTRGRAVAGELAHH